MSPVGALALLSLLLPFEPIAPVFTGLGMELGFVELAVAVCLGIAAAGLAGRLPRTMPLGLPTALFIVVCLVSTLFADEPRLLPLKASLRVIAGASTFFVTSWALQQRPRFRTLFAGFGAAALTVSGIAIAERVSWPGTFAFLELFREQTFEVGGAPRATASFAYPNLLGGFLAATLPMALFFRRERPRLTAAAASVIVLAVLLTHSRGALLGAFAATSLVWLLERDSLRERRYFLWLHGGFAVIVAVVLVAEPTFRFRATSEDDRGWYEARIEPAQSELTLAPSELTRTTVTIANTGRLRWAAGGGKPIHLSYRWFRRSGDAKVQPVPVEGERTRLDRPLEPGETRTVTSLVRAPALEGRYLLVWDMVHEHTTWFSDKVGLGAPVSVTVGDVREPAVDASADWSRVTRPWHPGRLELWTAALRLFATRPLLGVGPDNFRWLYGTAAGQPEWDRRTFANSLYLETLATTGIAGGLVLAALLAAALRGLVQGPRGLVSVALLASLTGLLVHGLFDYLLEATPMYVTFWVVLGAASARIAAREAA